jgi:GNAT superfamily N-acetyltransferase
LSSVGRPIGGLDQVTIRPVGSDELMTCATIWRDSLNDYITRLGQPEIPPETQSVVRLYGHLLATDPERFLAAVIPDGERGGERIIGFAAAYVREHLWYLSMLFVLPEFQGAGLGRRLLAEVGPGDPSIARAVATDSAQPISNALYASVGLVPRMPLFNLTGLPRRPEVLGALPTGIVPLAFDQIGAGPPDGQGHQMLVEAIDGLDCELLGVAHPMDHRFLRSEDRHGWLYRGPDGTPVGYGYAGEAGRIGPIAVLDPALVAPVIGHLTQAVVPRGAFAMWIGGDADRAVAAALQAGFRLDAFPILLAWDRPFADFARYMPASPGLL